MGTGRLALGLLQWLWYGCSTCAHLLLFYLAALCALMTLAAQMHTRVSRFGCLVGQMRFDRRMHLCHSQ